MTILWRNMKWSGMNLSCRSERTNTDHPERTKKLSSRPERSAVEGPAVSLELFISADHGNFGSHAPADDWGDEAELVHELFKLFGK
jgi:hypothetical protein